MKKPQSLMVLLSLLWVSLFPYILFQNQNLLVPGDILIVEGKLASGTKMIIQNLEIYPIFTIQWLKYLPGNNLLLPENPILAAIEMTPFALLIFQDDVLRIQLFQDTETGGEYRSSDYSELLSLSKRITENRAFAKSEDPFLGLSASDFAMLSLFIKLNKTNK